MRSGYEECDIRASEDNKNISHRLLDSQQQGMADFRLVVPWLRDVPHGPEAVGVQTRAIRPLCFSGVFKQFDPWSDIVPVVMERAATHQVAINDARFIDKNTATNF